MVITDVIGKALVVVDYLLGLFTVAGTGGTLVYSGACGGNLYSTDWDMSPCGMSIINQAVALMEVGMVLLNFIIPGLLVV